MSDRRLAASASVLAEAADALLGFADPVAARALVDRLLVHIPSWPADGRAVLADAVTTIERSGFMRRRSFGELLDGGARSRMANVRAAADVIRQAIVGAWASEPAVERSLGFDYRCLDAGPPTGAAPLEVSTFDRAHRDRADVVVVGSGAAGGVVAHDLAALGLSVIVLEAGDALGLPEGSPLQRIRRRDPVAGLATTTPTVVRLAAGSGVGGSTAGWFGTLGRPSSATLSAWARQTGLEDLGDDVVARRFERLEGLLGAGKIPDPLFGENANAVGSGAISAGLDVRAVRRAAPGCRGCGTCIAGCPTGALGGAQTLLSLAQRAGTQIVVGARVDRILVDDGRIAGVSATVDGGAILEVRAPIVVLAAGVLQTPRLLARNALGTRSGALGRGVHLQPSVWVAGSFDGAVRAWRGVPQTLRIEAPDGVTLQATAYPPGIASTLMPGFGLDLRRRIQQLETMAGVLVAIADDDAEGSVSPSGVRYELGQDSARRLGEGVRAAGTILFAAGARRVVTGLQRPGVVADQAALDDACAAIDNKTLMRLSAHDLVGGCAIGPDPARAVLTTDGEVHGIPGLFVADASSVPGPTGCPPALTVMAFAARIGERLATTAARYLR